MSVFKCKMCGGDLEIQPGQTVAQCEYCGTKQTLPRLDGDRKANLYDRANHFRRNNDYDKAMGIYEQILTEDNTDAEAYWSLVLCRYGIEYVEDPATHKRMPTVNRAQYTSIFDDDNYKSALEYADAAQREVYEAEAKAINEIQKGILAISQKEEPFDVFICYKETDQNGRRTQDSVLANDLYHQLTQEGFKVFFSRITLEDKLGTAYEPYIFAALNSAKVMVVLGTRPEYFNAVWVKNEWSRYLALIRSGAKKVLIPAYRDMDPYDLPEEFSHLQAQDMSKLGFMQDLIRGVKKLTEDAAPKQSNAKETVVVQQNAVTGNVQALLDRGNMALEDGEWEKADGFFEDVLNQNARCAEAYIGKLLTRDKKPELDSWVQMQKEAYTDATTERLEACPEDFGHIDQKVKELTIKNYLAEFIIRKLYVYDRGYNSALSYRKKQKEKQLAELSEDRLLSRAIQYASGDTKKQLDDAVAAITAVLDERIAKAQEENEKSIAQIREAYAAFTAETDKKAQALNSDAQNRREQDYQNAVEIKEKAENIGAYEGAIKALKAMNGYKDSDALVEQCEKTIENLKSEVKKKQEKAVKKRKTIIGIVAAVAVVCIAVVTVVTKVILPNINYNAAVTLKDSGDYKAAITAFEKTNGYRDSADQIEQCHAFIVSDKIASFANAAVGDTIVYGSYEQDNNTANGREDIEWVVLEEKENQILVVSRYALDCKAYNGLYTDVTWETCSLRTWLNKTFLSNAFTATEQAYIPEATVAADKNPEYSISAGSDTQDQIFLLSITEVEKYFSSDSGRQCEATAYAEAQGAYVNSSNGNCWWWLRSPGNYRDGAAGIHSDGVISYGGHGVGNAGDCVRPAMWISLEE